MLKSYKFTEEAIYIPLLLNTMLFKKDFCVKNNMYASQAFLKYLNKKICQELEAEIILIDFDHMILGDTGSIKEFCSNLNSCVRIVIYCNVNEKIFGIIETVFDGNSHGSLEEKVISNGEGFNYYIQSLKPFNEKRDQHISNIIKAFLKETCINEESFLPSSNLYANKYINVKNILTEQNINCLVMIQMYNLISSHIDENDYDSLVCASLNGAVIATLLGQMISKKVIYLMNLGPNLNIRDIESLGKIKVNEKYLFIADMLCTGTELKIAETIVNYRSAEIVGSIVVAQYLKSMSPKPVYKIFELNEADDFNYKVYTKKE